MASIAKLITELAKRAGVDLTDAKYAPLLTMAGDIPDEVDTAIQANLFNLDSARNNLELDKHFTGKSLGKIDKEILTSAGKHGLTEDQFATLKAEKNTYARVGLLNDMVAEKLAATGGSSADKSALTAEITKLNKQIADTKAATAAEIKAATDKAEMEISNYAHNAHFRSQSYANSEVPIEANAATARYLFDKYLKERGIVALRNGDDFVLKNASNPDLDYMENNQPVKYSDLTKRILADNKLLKVSDPAANGGSGNKKPNQQRHTETKAVDTSAVSEANRQAAADWKA